MMGLFFFNAGEEVGKVCFVGVGKEEYQSAVPYPGRRNVEGESCDVLGRDGCVVLRAEGGGGGEGRDGDNEVGGEVGDC